MELQTTPGIQFETAQRRGEPTALRADVAAMVGTAPRGPVHQPVRLEGWRQFRQKFGARRATSALARAAYGYFTNGGQVLWVVRIADPRAVGTAAADLSRQTTAVFRVVATSPGRWGNALEVRIQRRRGGATYLRGPGPLTERVGVESTAGFEPGTDVRVKWRVAGQSHRQIVRVVAVHDGVGEITLDRNLDDLVAGGASVDEVHLEALDYQLRVFVDGTPAETYRGLGLHPDHPRYAPEVLEQSQLVGLVARSPASQHQIEALSEDISGTYRLDGGRDGLRTLDVDHFTGTRWGDGTDWGVAGLEDLDEVGVLAVPGLAVTRSERRLSPPAAVSPVDPCQLDAPRQVGPFQGQVTDARTGQPLAGVTVEHTRVVDGTLPDEPFVTTDEQGRFQLGGDHTPVYEGKLTLVVNHGGYEPVESHVQVDADQLPSPSIKLVPKSTPRSLSDAEIRTVQQAMIDQCEHRRDRFALLSVPPEDGEWSSRRAVRWRRRFDSSFAALSYPHLVVETDGGRRIVAPGGHIAGLMAKTDHQQGPFAAAAGRRFRQVTAVTTSVDDAKRARLHHAGINVVYADAGGGIQLGGARTMSEKPNWRFVTTRRLFIDLRRRIEAGLQWAVFEPNDETLRLGVKNWLDQLLRSYWRRGAFAGDQRDEAYRVELDRTPEHRRGGRLAVDVRVAPARPLEFIVLELNVTDDGLQLEEV